MQATMFRLGFFVSFKVLNSNLRMWILFPFPKFRRYESVTLLLPRDAMTGSCVDKLP